ncbi:hypothetical protein SteCoe_34531 [Stentor coeruleus]|uniref:Uncharacterized protein n=1 Tax=Stentor coeruleus TaxID=5963 RepID=A0A1R2AUN2_9CILI|nr:hypothetical protein SteCoe_34531 [Stentor coeruleus]
MTLIISKVIHEQSLKSHESDQENSNDLSDEISNDPNIEQFLKQIKELKSLCKTQEEALLAFHQSMEATKEENDKLLIVLNEFENEKKGLSDFFIVSEIKSSIGFDCNSPASPVNPRSIDSPMFSSTIEGFEFEKQQNSKSYNEIHLKMHKCNLEPVEIFIFKSHISGLSI